MRFFPAPQLVATFVVLATLFVSACRSTTSDTSDVRGAPPMQTSSAPQLAPATPGAKECPVADVVCGNQVEPMACSAKEHEGLPLVPSKEVYAWGPNLCVARLNLARAACGNGLRPSKLARVECVPDPSEGYCPPPPPTCPHVLSPSTCIATIYGEQRLSAEQAVRAHGMSRCYAEHAIKASGCRARLDPRKLKGVACATQSLDGECPAFQAEPCKEPSRPAFCRALKAVGADLPKPLEARAPSACEAKFELAKLACGIGLRPSLLDDVVCEFGK